MQAAGDLLQFRDGLIDGTARLGQRIYKVLQLSRDHGLDLADLQPDGDEPLLRAVVQVALDPVAPCSSAAAIRAREALSSSWLCALAIAAAASSVKSRMRSSVSRGSGCGVLEVAIAAPHSHRPTMIGQPTEERIPARSAAGELAVALVRSTRPGSAYARRSR